MVWLAVAAASLLAGVVQTVTGFGAVVTMMMVLPFFFDMIDAPALALIINQSLCIVLFWQYRRSLPRRTALLPTLLFSAGSLVTIRLAGRLPTEGLVVALGVLLICLSVYFLLVAARIRLRPSRWVGAVCGFFSGMSAGLFAIGGPPMALYFISACEDQRAYLACMQFLLTVTGFVSLAGRIWNGILHAAILPYAAVGTACILAGIWIGEKINGRLNAARARTMVYIFVGISGLILLLQHIG